MASNHFNKDFCVPRDVIVEGIPLPKLLTESFIGQADIFIDNLIESLNGENNNDENYRDSSFDRSDLIEYVRNVLTGKPVGIIPSSLAGISGFSTFLFAKAYFIKKDELFNDKKFPNIFGINKDEYRTKLCGKICDYIYSSASEGGHLSVDTLEEEYYSTSSFLNCEPDRATFLHWDIEIPEGLYRVFERCDDGFHLNPFPQPELEDVKFAPQSLDPDDSRSIWCRCLTHKLYAEDKTEMEHGKDKRIIIRHVYRQICERDSEGIPLLGPLEPIDKSHPDYHLYHDLTEKSCIDIMFKGKPPEVQLPRQAEYCLGRCKQPAVINSGGV